MEVEDLVQLSLDSHQQPDQIVRRFPIERRVFAHGVIVSFGYRYDKMAREDYGRCGTGVGSKASFTLRQAFALSPSSAGWRPPSSRRASATSPSQRTA